MCFVVVDSTGYPDQQQTLSFPRLFRGAPAPDLCAAFPLCFLFCVTPLPCTTHTSATAALIPIHPPSQTRRPPAAGTGRARLRTRRLQRVHRARRDPRVPPVARRRGSSPGGCSRERRRRGAGGAAAAAAVPDQNFAVSFRRRESVGGGGGGRGEPWQRGSGPGVVELREREHGAHVGGFRQGASSNFRREGAPTQGSVCMRKRAFVL